MMLPKSEGYVPESVLWRLAAYAIWRSYANSLTVIRLRRLVDDQQFAALDRASGAVTREDRIRHICDFGRDSILDLVPAPTALVEDGRVLAVNRPWLVSAAASSEDLVGRELRPLVLSGRARSDIAIGDHSIVVLTDVKREEQHPKEIAQLTDELRSLQGTIIPSRLLDEDIKAIHTGFIIMCTIALVRGSNDVQASDWVGEVREFESWIIERCKAECEDVDFLQRSSRDFKLLFGLARLYSRELLVEIAILIAVDAMRWAIESRGKSHEYRFQCPHYCRRRKRIHVSSSDS
jgi:hypothetical protein